MATTVYERENCPSPSICLFSFPVELCASLNEDRNPMYSWSNIIVSYNILANIDNFLLKYYNLHKQKTRQVAVLTESFSKTKKLAKK